LNGEQMQQAAATKHYQSHSGFSLHANVVISHATCSIVSPKTSFSAPSPGRNV
jgi:hypothetical protein